MYKYIKRFFDILFSLIAIIILLPVFILVIIILLLTGANERANLSRTEIASMAQPYNLILKPA